MYGMFLVFMLLVKGCQTIGKGPNKTTATIIGEHSASYIMMVHWYLLFSGQEFQDLIKILLHFLQYIIDVWHVPSVYVACKGLSDDW